MKNNKKYFVVSDIHSFFKPFREALNKAGFDLGNKNHILLILGDVFDRGPDTLPLYDFVMSIPKDRRILVRGNHESLYKDLLEKKFPQSHDFSNGTVDTFCQIANLPGINRNGIENGYYFREGSFYDSERISEESQKLWNLVLEEVRKSEITNWIKSDEWINYYELDKYIFVHSFIPTKIKKEFEQYRLYFQMVNHPQTCEYDPNWRQADDYTWEEAMWGCPWKNYLQGLSKPEHEKGKVIVCGHWHSYAFREHLDGVVYTNVNEIDFGIYYSKDLIAIDACTSFSNQCNVMVIDSIE